MSKVKASLLFVSSLLMSPVYATDDLMQVFSQSLENDPQLLAQMAETQAVNELDAQAKARFLPQVSLGADAGYTWQDTNNRSLDYNSRGLNLTITQSLYREQNTIQQNQATIAISSADASYRIVEQELIVRVAEVYFGVLGSQDDLRFAMAEREAIAKQLEQTKQRFEVGIATITDVVESQAAYDAAHASVITAENELANSKERLAETSGHYLDDLAVLKLDTPLVSPEPENRADWSAIALEQNPSLVVAKLAVDNASETIKLRKTGHRPTLDLVGSAGYNGQSDSLSTGSSNTRQENISLQFNLPLYTGGGVESQTREATYRLDKAMQTEEQQRRAVVRQSREAYNGVISGISRVKAFKQAVVSSEKALESTEAGYEVGTRTTVDVLNVRRDLFRAKRDYASSRYDYILSILRLKQAAGIVNVDDLAQINQWLETN